eukprot:1160075-Pelagomonas_calceolata.AAC.6
MHGVCSGIDLTLCAAQLHAFCSLAASGEIPLGGQQCYIISIQDGKSGRVPLLCIVCCQKCVRAGILLCTDAWDGPCSLRVLFRWCLNA